MEVVLKNKGFTLIELMISVAIIGIIAIVIATLFFRGCSSALTGDKETAVSNMRTFAQEMGWKMLGGTCVDTDSDGDGYISCTVSIQGGEGQAPVEKALLCASGAILARTGGCKLAQGVYQQ